VSKDPKNFGHTPLSTVIEPVGRQKKTKCNHNRLKANQTMLVQAGLDDKGPHPHLGCKQYGHTTQVVTSQLIYG